MKTSMVESGGAGAYIQELSDLLWLGKCSYEERFIAMLGCYLDDSDNQAESHRIIAVGGCLAHTADWVRLCNRWEPLLEEFGLLPDPGYFRMADFENRVGPYSKWPDDARIPRFLKLLKTIRDCTGLLVGTAVILDDYNELVNTDELKAKYGTPYSICAQACMQLLGRWSEKTLNIVPVQYFIERRRGNYDLIEAFRKALACRHTRLKYRLGSMTEVDKKVSPVQVADIVAYETPKQLLRTLGVDERPPRKSFARLTGEVPYVNRYFDREVLAELITTEDPHKCEPSCFEE